MSTSRTLTVYLPTIGRILCLRRQPVPYVDPIHRRVLIDSGARQHCGKLALCPATYLRHFLVTSTDSFATLIRMARFFSDEQIHVVVVHVCCPSPFRLVAAPVR